MRKTEPLSQNPNARMKAYLGKIATGPRMSKDLTEAEAEDALSMVLDGSVSTVRAGIFLIAARMKLETVPENIGYWRALDKKTLKHLTSFDRLLQVADPFDGFTRVPYFGFYAIPVIAGLGLPVYGHSARSLPPKFGITFEDILTGHYQVSETERGEKRVALLKEHKFGYINTRHCHPSLERLRELRTEIVKRTMLSTLEKMLMPVKAKSGGNFLATSYFHRGYEVPMMAVARLSEFDKTVVGNGMEGTTLFGVHKSAEIFIDSGKAKPEIIKLVVEKSFSPDTAEKIAGTYEDLQKEKVRLHTLADWGEQALRAGRGPAASLIACQAGTLCHLLGLFPTPQGGYDAAQEVLHGGKSYTSFMRFVENCR